MSRIAMNRSNRSPFALTKPNYRIRAQQDETEVLMYDEIGFFGINAEQFVREFQEIESPNISLRINSPGGSVFEGLTIANAISRHKATVTAHVDGLAASIASVIAMSADKVVMAKNAYMMIHEPWSIVVGGADEMRKEADLLDKVGGTIVQSYVDKSGAKESEIRDLLKEETWLTADEAIELGLADELEDAQEAEDKFDLSIFNNVPKDLRDSDKAPNPRRIEAAIREAGCSWSEAKAIVSGGLRSLRDEKTEPRDGPDAETIKKYMGAFKL